MNALVTFPLRLVETSPAGEHVVGKGHQFLFVIDQLPRRVLERGQLVHAVVHDGRRRQVTAPAEHHRSVIPRNMIPDLMFVDKLIK
jgi:hypothetical protein